MHQKLYICEISLHKLTVKITIFIQHLNWQTQVHQYNSSNLLIYVSQLFS